MRRIALAAVALITAFSAVCASGLTMGNETISYSYDAQGRLTNVTHAGSVNSNLQANYTYDKANNRVTMNVTGAP